MFVYIHHYVFQHYLHIVHFGTEVVSGVIPFPPEHFWLHLNSCTKYLPNVDPENTEKKIFIKIFGYFFGHFWTYFRHFSESFFTFFWYFSGLLWNLLDISRTFFSDIFWTSLRLCSWSCRFLKTAPKFLLNALDKCSHI